MSDRDRINRRDFIVTTAGVAGTASAFAEATLTAAQAQAQAQAQASPPPGFVDQEPFAKYWATNEARSDPIRGASSRWRRSSRCSRRNAIVET